MSGHTDDKVGVREIRRLHREGQPIAVVTAYDAPLARLADECGADILLVGDSLGMTVLGYRTTIPVTLEQSLHHTAAVVRGTKRAMVIGDMPFLTYQISPDQALNNAGRYLQEAGADGVKLEGGVAMAPTARRLVGVGIPVLGHVGILPQSVLTTGGYRLQGRTPQQAQALRDDVQALQDAGVFAIVLEGISRTLATELTEQLSIPTIGIGAGAGCSGQVQVIHDLLGLIEDFKPHHAKQYADLATAIRAALTQYVCEVRKREFPTDEHSFE